MPKDLSLQAIRELQTLRLVMPGAGVFRAYAQAPVSFSFNESLDQLGGTFGKILSATMMLSGRAPVLDYERKFMYRGLEPINLNFNCFLILDDFMAVSKASRVDDSGNVKGIVSTQFRDPLQSLFNYMLPKRKEDLTKDGGIADSIFGTVKDGWNWILTQLTSLIGSDTTVGSLLTDMQGDENKSLADTIGQVWTLDLPPQYEIKSHEKAVACWGRFKWKEVNISSVSITIPQLIYEDGLPQYIQVALGLKSLRMPALNTDGSGTLFEIMDRDETTRSRSL